MAKTILVTGCAGYLGGLFVPRLLAHPLVKRVVGVDVAAPRLSPHPKLHLLTADIRDEYLLRSVLEEEGVDTIFHLAFRNADGPEKVLARETNIHGTLVVLEAADKCPRVGKMVIAGSTAAYGARRGNPRLIGESQPLRASGLSYAVHKRRIEEELAKALPQLRRGLQVSILRLAMVVGPSERPDGPVRRLSRLPFCVSPLGRRGGMQFLSEEDAVAALCRALEAQELRGAFNVVPDDALTTAEVCRALGKLRLPLPGPLLWLALCLGRRLLGTSIPEGVASYLSHPIVASNKKFKEALGFTFAHGSREALQSCVSSLEDRPAPLAAQA